MWTISMSSNIRGKSRLSNHLYVIKVTARYTLKVLLNNVSTLKKISLLHGPTLDEWDFWKMWMLEAFGGKSWEPVFLTYFEYAESDTPGTQAKVWVLDHLICIDKMAAKLPLLQQFEAVSFYKSVTKRTKWTTEFTEMSLSMQWTSVNRIGSVLRL